MPKNPFHLTSFGVYTLWKGKMQSLALSCNSAYGQFVTDQWDLKLQIIVLEQAHYHHIEASFMWNREDPNQMSCPRTTTSNLLPHFAMARICSKDMYY